MKKGVLAAIIAVIATALIAFFVVGNNDEKSTDSSNTDTNNSTNTQPSGSDAGSDSGAADENVTGVETNDVSMTDNEFGPGTITVKKGATVTWTNNGDLPHTVTSESAAGPKSETIQPDETYSFTFNEVGTFDYICEFHPGMTGKVIVTE